MESIEYDVDAIVDEIRMNERTEELKNSTFKIVEFNGTNIKLQCIENDKLFVDIVAKYYTSYLESKGDE